MRLVPFALAIALTVAACSSTESSAPSPSADAGEMRSSGTAPTVDTPDGTQAVEVDALGIGFAVPDAYTVIDPTELGVRDYESDWFADLAESAGLSAEELTAALRSNLELFLFAPVGTSGFSDHITVEARPDEQLPTRDEVRDQLELLGVSDMNVTSGPVDGAEVIDVTYRDDGEDRAGYDMYVEQPDGLVVVSVAAAEEAAAGDVGDLLIETLQVAG